MRTVLIYSLCVIAVISALGGMGIPVAYATNPTGVNYVPLAPIDVAGSEFTSATFDKTSNNATSDCIAPTCFPRYLRTIYNIGVALAGLFAVVSIVRGGFTLIFTDSILGHSEAKGIILRALGGLLIVYSSYIFMNAISPSLGSDLDLSLDFGRVRIQAEDLTSLNVALTEQQLKQLDDATIKRRDELQKRIDDNTVTLVANRLALETARSEGDSSAITTLQQEISSLESQIADDNIALAHNVGRQASLHGSNATTQQKAQEALTNATKSGGAIDQTRAKFTAARTLIASNPGKLADSYFQELQEISVINKSIAFGILDNPPASVYRNPATGVETTSQNLTAAMDIAKAQMTAIDNERKKQITALIGLSAGSTLTSTQKTIARERIHATANEQICQIRNACKSKGSVANSCQNHLASLPCQL
ncbi:MAG: hypothetical protein Q7R64_00860 [bacterium]|nr:hypothetical protein [bacterium]